MIPWYGYRPASSTVYLPFHSFAAATGASAAASNFVAGDVLVYKNGGTTQRTSSNGITVSTSFDSQTGLQLIAIDLSDNTDAGFYAAGNNYLVAVADITIDSQTVRAWVGSFDIGPAQVDVRQYGGTAGTFSGGRPEVNASHAAGTAWNSGAIGASTLAADTIAAAKIATGAITSAKFAAGAIDAAAIASDAIAAAKIATGAITSAKFAAGAINAAAIADGAIDAATFAADVDAEILSYLVDDATRIDASALNTATGTTIPAIVADTNELQTDWVDGGRLDLLIDAIKAKADNLPSDPADASVIAGRFDTLDTSIADLPTNAELATALGTADDAVLAQVALVKTETDKIASIKSKTDSLTYTVAGVVDANLQRINDVAVTGDGQPGTEFAV